MIFRTEQKKGKKNLNENAFKETIFEIEGKSQWDVEMLLGTERTRSGVSA